MAYAARLLLASLMAAAVCCVCCLLGCGVCLACLRTTAAWRRRRIEACCRDEVARGLAEIERYLGARAPRSPRGQSPDLGNDADF